MYSELCMSNDNNYYRVSVIKFVISKAFYCCTYKHCGIILPADFCCYWIPIIISNLIRCVNPLFSFLPFIRSQRHHHLQWLQTPRPIPALPLNRYTQLCVYMWMCGVETGQVLDCVHCVHSSMLLPDLPSPSHSQRPHNHLLSPAPSSPALPLLHRNKYIHIADIGVHYRFIHCSIF